MSSRAGGEIVALTGPRGQVGYELRRALAPLGRVVVCDRERLDLADADSIRTALDDIRPTLVVNAAAYTAVDDAEREPEVAMAVNAEGPGILAEQARRLGAGLVQYSTDYVFSGDAARPYREDDREAPLGAYGASKLAGEQAIAAAGAGALILRTGWVYGRRGRNFLLTVERLAAERERLAIVDDQVGAPTWCRLLAEATAQLLAPGRGALEGYLRERGGLYHLSCAGSVSWCGFARRILEIRGTAIPVDAIDTAAYPTLARRPPYSVLDNARVRAEHGVHMPPWDEALALALAD
ncbi:MAG: dTDP-4-dehydrorhamnose reductase [Gammaproteobacteria bacterium]|nr:dTDP-4-dehydrorhamnose reductase [Gammaproteobacteria bacterium]